MASLPLMFGDGQHPRTEGMPEHLDRLMRLGIAAHEDLDRRVGAFRPGVDGDMAVCVTILSSSDLHETGPGNVAHTIGEVIGDGPVYNELRYSMPSIRPLRPARERRRSEGLRAGKPGLSSAAE